MRGPMMSPRIKSAEDVMQWRGAGVALAATAGAVDSFALTTIHHYSSHMSGTTTQLGEAFVQADPGLTVILLSTLVAFFAGSALSGAFIVRAIEADRRRTISALLCAEVVLILLGMTASLIALFPQQLVVLVMLAAAMGLQNSVGARFLKHGHRTTHVTGTLTDIGYHSGRLAFRKRRTSASTLEDRAKLLLLAATFCGFLTGGILCHFLALAVAPFALLLPAIVVGSLASLTAFGPAADMPGSLR